MSGPVLEVDALTKRFGTVTAVDAVSFSVAHGSTAALLGANGAGKTTTMAMIMGLLLPSAGAVRVFGRDMASDRYALLPRMNFSSPYTDLPHRLTVRENLTVYARLYGLTGVRRRIERTGRHPRPRRLPQAADRQAVSRAAHPGGARQGAAQRPRAAAARRAFRLARPGHGRLGAGRHRALPGRDRRHDPARLPQHGRGGAPLRRRVRDVRRPHRRERHARRA